MGILPYYLTEIKEKMEKMRFFLLGGTFVKKGAFSIF
jgi:hypothetical protein